MTVMQSGGGGGPSPTGLADVIETILDKGMVIDAYVRVSLVGIEVLTIDARVVIASVDTYLRFAEAVNRLDISQEKQGLVDLVGPAAGKAVESGAKHVTKGKLDAAADKLRNLADSGEPERPAPCRREEPVPCSLRTKGSQALCAPSAAPQSLAAGQWSGVLLSQPPQAPAQGGQFGAVNAVGLSLGHNSGDVAGHSHALILRSALQHGHTPATDLGHRVRHMARDFKLDHGLRVLGAESPRRLQRA